MILEGGEGGGGGDQYWGRPMVNKGGVPKTFQNVTPITKTMTFAFDFAHCNIEQVLQLKPCSEIWGGVILPNTKLGKITPPQIPDQSFSCNF